MELCVRSLIIQRLTHQHVEGINYRLKCVKLLLEHTSCTKAHKILSISAPQLGRYMFFILCYTCITTYAHNIIEAIT